MSEAVMAGEMNTNRCLSVVIPAKDEAENIGLLLSEIHAVFKDYPEYEVVVVDDGSSDATSEVVEKTARLLNCPARVVRHIRSVGQSGALRTGILNARGNLIVTLDGDGQNVPADIPALIQKAAEQGNEDFCIAGYRRDRKDTRWKRFQSRLANRVRSAMLRDGVPDTGCGLKMFPKSTFLKLPWFDHGHRFIPALVRGIGGDIVVVTVNHRGRAHGQSKYSAWNRAWAGILDLAGVMWLVHRTKVAHIENSD